MAPLHHELCFGCGKANLFGLLAELDATDATDATKATKAEATGATDTDAHPVTARCFIKQDHQGADRGSAHPGIVATALAETMMLANGPQARLTRIEIDFLQPAPVGTFLEVEARPPSASGRADEVTVARPTSASARADGTLVAHATATVLR